MEIKETVQWNPYKSSLTFIFRFHYYLNAMKEMQIRILFLFQ